MPKSCSVPGCRSGTFTDRKERKLMGIRQASLFQAPSNIELRKKWSKTISPDKELSAYDFVCECHFDGEDIERCDQTTMGDGIINVINKRAYLKKNAIPSLLSSSLKDNDCLEGQSFTQMNISMPCSKKRKLDNAHSSSSRICKENKFTFLELSENLISIEKPDKMWAISHHENVIFCARWTEKFTVQKLVVLEFDLKYKVFVCNEELTDTDCEEISSIADVNRILERMEKYVICKNVLDGCRNLHCEVLVSKNPPCPLRFKDRPRIFCKKCLDNCKKTNVCKSIDIKYRSRHSLG